MKKSIGLILILLFTSCFSNNKNEKIIESTTSTNKIKNREPTSLSTKQKREIKLALRNLLTRDNFDAFIIIIEQNTDKFIQFAVDNGNLVLDLPSSQLNDYQLEKANKILKDYQILFEIQKTYDPNDETKVVGEFGVFNKDIGNDIDLAFEIIEKVITQIFQVDGEIDLNIIEN